MISSGAPTTYVYNAGNELTTLQDSSGTTTSTYDGCGNLVTSVAPGNLLTTNTWDGENRPTQVALPSGVVDIFRYNGDGQRVQKQDSTGTTKHLWDGQNILLETNASNVIQVVYSLAPALYGNLISQTRSGTDSFYLFDALGAARQLANSTMSVTDSYLYDSFGNNLATSGTATNSFRYVGRFGYYYDLDLTWFYLRARYYNILSGRFVTRDPLWFSARPSLESLNAYLYASNSPISLMDPSGELIKRPRWEPPTGWNPFTSEWWGYGNYCGWYRRGQNGAPIDALDSACQEHDKCQAGWDTCNQWDIERCSQKLCADAREAYDTGCERSWPGQINQFQRWHCQDAAVDVMRLFCTVGTGLNWFNYILNSVPPILAFSAASVDRFQTQ